MFRRNPEKDYPQIDNTAYIDPTAVIIGKVKIGKDVFVAPGAVIRADEPKSSITIKDNCNIQDRVIIHALANTSVLIEENTSLAHGCIIHGPCKIGKHCFVGFNSVVFNAEIDDGVCIKHLVVVEGVSIVPERIVESSQLVNSEDKVRELSYVDKSLKNFARNVIKVNLDLAKRYKE
jgi:carbonic anhydrase/acetyltransferase-like protein (isoleucine patch superfamily)